MRYPTVDYKVVPSAARQYLVSCVPGTGSLNETTSTCPVRMLHLRTHRIDKEVSPQASWACSRIYSRRYGIDGLLRHARAMACVAYLTITDRSWTALTTGQAGVKDVVTLFHNPKLPTSTRVHTLLKQLNAASVAHATEDQASDHSKQSKQERTDFELGT